MSFIRQMKTKMEREERQGVLHKADEDQNGKGRKARCPS